MSALFVHNPINPNLGRIVVLGQYMLYKDEVLDLADIEEYSVEAFITSEWARHGEYGIIEDLFENRIFKQQCKIEIEALSVRDEGYLIKLADDHDESVRLAVANQGYYLPKHVIDKLIVDDSVLVRRAIVRKCFINQEDYPDLINDKNNEVRREIARRGIFLDTLIHDEDAEVRRLAEKSIADKIKNDINNDSLIAF